MGYIYGYKSKKLCCDCCGEEGARKRACPHGYCPSAALCSTCLKAVKNDGRWFRAHCRCKAGHDTCVARENLVKNLLDNGQYVRCSALGVGDKVHVLFENKAGETIGKFMNHETYDQIPLLTPAMPQDYEKFGEVTDAPDKFCFGGTTKQCTVEEILA